MPMMTAIGYYGIACAALLVGMVAASLAKWPLLFFIGYVGAGVFLNRTVLGNLIQWHPMYNKLDSVFRAKVVHCITGESTLEPQILNTSDKERNKDRKPQFGVPDDVSVNVFSWQGQGFSGELWYNAGKEVVAVQRPNMRCTEDLYSTEAEAHAACRARIEEMTYRATVSKVDPAMNAPVLIFANSEREAMVFGRKVIAEFGRAGMSIEVDLPSSQRKFVARRKGDDVLCSPHFENPRVRPPASEYVTGLFAPRHESQQRDAMRMLDQFETKTEVRDDVVRWRSNDRVPPQACVDLWRNAAFFANPPAGEHGREAVGASVRGNARTSSWVINPRIS